jgi:hypothetical protein
MTTAIAKTGGALVPQSMAEAMKLSEALASTTMVPKECRGRPEEVLARVLYGSGLGMNPLQAVNAVSLINGKPTLWGDGLVAVCRSHPAFAGLEEKLTGAGEDMAATVIVHRKGEPPLESTFSVADAKRAGLWGRSGPWSQYPQRMLMARARGFALRVAFADALMGLIDETEARDYPSDAPAAAPVVHEVPAAPATPLVDVKAVQAAIDAATTPDALEKVRARITQRVMEGAIDPDVASELVDQITQRLGAAD